MYNISNEVAPGGIHFLQIDQMKEFDLFIRRELFILFHERIIKGTLSESSGNILYPEILVKLLDDDDQPEVYTSIASQIIIRMSDKMRLLFNTYYNEEYLEDYVIKWVIMGFRNLISIYMSIYNDQKKNIGGNITIDLVNQWTSDTFKVYVETEIYNEFSISRKEVENASK